MKTTIITLALLGSACLSKAQMYTKSPFNEEYPKLTKQANELYEQKKYRESGEAFSKAFYSNGNKGLVGDRYSAACSWAMAGEKDSAFTQLQKISNARFTEYNHLMIDPDLDGLHDDPRWSEVANKVRENRSIGQNNLNIPLQQQLDTVMQEDQKYRMRLDAMTEKYGRDSKELQQYWKMINEKDSINLIKVTTILDKYDWPGPDVVGREGNSAVFLVIQHADTKTQEKYLPVMRGAVKDKKAQPSALALLEDRVALAEGKKQIYGSQIGMDAKGNSYVDDLEDPEHVDERRASVGLPPIADYVQQWNIKWDVAEYKKQEAARQKSKKKSG